MTLSNFDWTDKTSVKWFIMLSTGHEGPYSLEGLLKRKTHPEMKIWAEGLSEAVTLQAALNHSQNSPDEISDEDEIPPLPDLSIEPDINVPPLPVEREDAGTPNHKLKIRLGFLFILLFFSTLGLKEWLKGQEHFSIRRTTGMSPELFQKICSDFKFEGWDRKIFFKEFVPADMSHIWLVTSGFQACQVEAVFTSVKGKLLSQQDEKVSFKTASQLQNHMAEFSKFDFTSGSKIIPGLYEMDLKASACHWDGLSARLGNWFTSPETHYVTRMKVVLYHKGSVEFNTILDKLINKKIQTELKNQNQEDLFWQDFQQKLQTLLAISLQIEQLLLEFIEAPPANFQQGLKTMVDKYTKNYGHFLTEFVVANEKYFQDLEKSNLSHMSQKRGYEKVIRVTSTNVGLESMKIIEQLQSWKKPTAKDLERMGSKIKKQFEGLKSSINNRIIQLTEDRTH